MAGSKPRYTAAQVCAALTASKGLVYLAAKRLKCDPDTVNNYCKRYPSVKAARDAQRGEMVDLAEQKLYESIRKGEAWGITLCLKTLGRDRGYIERQEFGGAPGEPIIMKVVYDHAPYDASIDVTPQHALQDGHGPAQ